MLSMNKKTDYALLALSYLTRIEPGRTANTKEIAEQHDLPVELLAKIMQILAKARLVVSTSGPTGGYRLAKPAAEISVGAIIEIIEGRPALAQCMRSVDNVCGQHDKCTIRTPMMRINARIFQMLDHVSLAEINGEDEPQMHSADVEMLSARPQLSQNRNLPIREAAGSR